MFTRIVSVLLAVALAGSAFAASNVLQLNYDAAGNITQIQRQTAPGFAITGFSPTSGPPGTPVTIYGMGFSTTPANNVMAFNGTSAVVATSEAGSIGTTVPDSAASGRITVTVNGVTVSSPADFVVTVPGAPAINTFNPASGAPATAITVTGSNFDPAGTVIKLNGIAASATVSSATDLAFNVPPAAASGKITATTSLGTGTSLSDFIVPPPGMALTDIEKTLRVSVGGPSGNIAVGTPAKSGLVLFDALPNTYYSAHLGTFETSPTTATLTYKIVAPNNIVVSTGTVNANADSIHLPKTTLAGTYSIVLSPGNATLNTNVRVVPSPVLILDGAPVASGLDSSGQTARMVFDAVANQRIGIGLIGVAIAPSGAGQATVSIFKPDGSELGGNRMQCNAPWSGNLQANCENNLTAPVTGTYSLLLQPPQNAMANASVQISSDVTASLTIDTPTLVSIGRVGQNANLTFTASAGDSLAVDVSAIALQPQPQSIFILVSRPDGSRVGCSTSPPAGAYCELNTVASTGTYSLWMSPSYGAYGTFKVTIKRGPTLTTTDAPLPFAPPNAAEHARFTFSATAGKVVNVALTGLAINGSSTSSSSAALSAYRSDGTAVLNTLCTPAFGGGSCRARLANITTSGTYSISVAPPADGTVSGQVSISDELAANLDSGISQVLSATRPGQSMRVTFPGTAGDNMSVKVFGVSTSIPNQQVTFNLYKPDGTFYSSGTTTGPTASTITTYSPLPVTGTYAAIVEPVNGSSWQAQMGVDLGTLIALDGATVSPSGAIGEPLRYRVPINAGQRIEFGLSGLAYAAPSAAASTMTIYSSIGQNFGGATCTTSGAGACEAVVASAPVTGTYTLVLMPPAASAITGGTFALSTPATGTLVANDPTQVVSVARPGQTARYTFAGAAGQLLRLNWSGAVVSSGASVAVSVLKPDGSALSNSSFVNGATGGLDLASLPVAGTYTVVFDPSLAATFSTSASLATR